MIRILILILALNAFISPISAKSVCFMPMGSEVMGAMDTMQETTMTSEHCAQMDNKVDVSCCSFECSSDCASHFSSFSALNDSSQPFFIGMNTRPQTVSPHFYKLVLPIKTPPPLV